MATIGPVTAEPDEHTGGPRPVPAWMRLAEGDKRLALVTFTATLAANMATALIIALALIADHVMNRYTRTSSHNSWSSPWPKVHWLP